ncbi:uncharacterized protein BO80DRAFT_499763 [Aspergillus ibericus CBS 121593]|uniref:Transcription factor domain-containing protein n=1 Tax=Aspergillus ibericus CBS 121593 TaxID=1448316 RepID=A0A395HA02_9EURO|nr:hypothetical protein BO80DRAFT_499763 [Aspergillus ibericus CBS 121593]RAL04466.1 hypothetical protein BO80DRAFT_499763 [Aspergillus ibericus CBS 121593]
MRQERHELRAMTDHLIALAGEMKTKLGGDAAPIRASNDEDENTNAGLIGHIFRDYEALRTVGSPLSPLSDTHVILNGILNGWNGSVSDEEEPIQRLMAHLHRRFMLERPLARPIDQLAVLDLVQMSFLFLLSQHGGCQSWASQIPGWLRPTPAQVKIPHNISIDMLPWPQLRIHLLSTQLEAAVSTHTQPCETFAVNALRNLYFSPLINFQDAYEIGLDRRIAVSAQFQQYFAPTSVSCPFSVDSEFLTQYPDFRGLVPDFKDPAKAMSRSHGGSSIPLLQSLSPLSQSGLVLEGAAMTASNDETRCLSLASEGQHLTNTDEISSSLSPLGPHSLTRLSPTMHKPENTDQHQPHSLTDHTVGNTFSNELSDIWQDSVDLLAGDSDATWLLSSNALN